MTIMKYAGVLPFSRTSDTISEDEVKRLCDALKNFRLKVTGTMSWNNAQVTAGGILTKDVDSKTLESKGVVSKKIEEQRYCLSKT